MFFDQFFYRHLSGAILNSGSTQNACSSSLLKSKVEEEESETVFAFCGR